jgi:nitrogen fixation protein NifX
MGLSFSRETALRIGRATQALPGVTVADLVDGLARELGWPLDEGALGRITVSQLRNALIQGRSSDADPNLYSGEIADRFPVSRLKHVVEILWGQRVEEEEVAEAPLDRYEDGEMPGSIRIAVASDAGEDINAHFGSARRYLIYQVSPTEIRLIDIRRTDLHCTDEVSESLDGSSFRVRLIDDCHLLVVQSIGGPAAAKVVNAGIYPLKHVGGGPARAYIATLQERMASSPPPWLAKAMNIPLEDRIRLHMEVEN